ncbi:MAG: DUF5009 domain-containing protein, partial [Bacteroidia bacterium]|nr:DUF5009 domain-containing protein [Bacteroidia bacterium]
DLIFPAFLFCMGMSVPFAIEKRFSKGDSVLEVIKHILYRTFALVLMGLCTLNSGGVAGGLSHQVIILLMVLSFFLCFAVYPDLSGKGKFFIYGAKLLGFAIIAFIIVYKDLNGKSFKVSWWGILALIGWTYAV